MKAGIGSAAIRYPNGLVVAAIVAVNAVGDIIDPMTGQVIAGVRGPDGKLADARKRLRAGTGRDGRAGENTTIGVVATNARLTKVQAQKVAQMAHDGYARAISPIHTPGDGDTIFSAGHGHVDRRGQLRHDRRARRRSDGRRHRPRRDPGDGVARPAKCARSRNGSGAIQAVDGFRLSSYQLHSYQLSGS